jgi:hypothetical protein
VKTTRILTFLVIALAVYVIAYLVLMDRSAPAYDDEGVRQYSSSFRFAPSILIKDRFTSVFRKVTFANKVFYPADLVFGR